ncbi:SLBB domain-containing protein [Sphingobium sp.]|uniref:polysaccharide biosynthesis/export family protein n=1 Tax=Sphingobium sp. TaxID=1912891 RepID=UPI003B3A3795
MILPRSLLLTGAALASFGLPHLAQAQLSSPLGGSGQSADGTPAARAKTDVSIPSAAAPAPFQPAVIQGARADASAPDGPPPNAPKRAKTEMAAPNEFEAYVSDVVGKPLRRFGSELLLPESRDFTAPSSAAVPDDYRLNPGDQLRLDLSGSVQANDVLLTIDSEGRIFVPKVGAITVGGQRYGDVHDVIARQVSRQYRNFDLQISIARLKGLTVYVTGFAERPGAYTVNSLSTLVNAVLAAGGPGAGGSFRSIQLRRGGKLVSDFDLYDLLLRGDKGGDAALQNGDVIHIAPTGTLVALIGSVNREAIYEVGPNETVDDALRYAGGASSVADASRLMLFDSLGHREIGWQELKPADARSRIAQRGDIIRVLSDIGIARPLGQQPVLVTISGEVTKPGRYYVQPGTRLSDVVSQAGGLTTDAFPYASVITRQSVKAQQKESFDRAVKDMELLLSTQPLVSVNRAQLATPGNQALIQSVVQKMQDREPTGRLVFNLPVTATQLPADLIVENNDAVFVPTRPVTVGVFGAVPTPASFAYDDGKTIGDFVKTAGGIQKLGDKKEIFVVRANGTVLADGGSTLRAKALPGDLVFVPVDADRGEFWARLRDITSSLFGGFIGAASVAAVVN